MTAGQLTGSWARIPCVVVLLASGCKSSAPGGACVDSATSLTWNGHHASVVVASLTSSARTYTLTTDQPGRADATRTTAAGGSLTFGEQAGQPYVRSGNTLFDALFALALEDLRRMSIDTVHDGAYDGGNAVPCPATGSGGCFQTGVKWTYVWTRDSAYAIDLGLAQLDPVRAMNTLAFKTSARRGLGAGTTEIVQDTGSGGSWPVSSDRVVWARGAWEVLKYLSGTARQAFASEAYTAIRNTVEDDRLALYDPADGLYRGEMSFLDWREQSYAKWTASSVVDIGMSKTLSTNVAHWKILDVAASLATELGLPADAARYRGWADGVKAAVNAELWLEDVGLYGVMKPTTLNPAPVHQYETLGEALAVLEGIASDERAALILANVLHTEAGAPVVSPQMPGLSVYHNAAIWPFVSAYLLVAASIGHNDAVVNANLCTLVRGAALSLSNMENFRFTDLASTPPTIDSEAQLWSIGGYLGMVLDVTFGRQATQDGLRFHPFVTKRMRNELFRDASELVLANLPYRGKTLTVHVELPPADGSTSGYYQASSATLDGAPVAVDAYLTADQLGAASVLELQLADADAAAASITVLADDGDPKRFFAPKAPFIDPAAGLTLASGLLTVHYDVSGETDTLVSLYRNGSRVAADVTGGTWLDPDSGDASSMTLCYAAEQRFRGRSGVSHRSKPVCYWPAGAITTIAAGDAALTTNDATAPILDHGRTSYSDWGQPAQTMDAAFTPATSGTYYVQFVYGNAFGSVTTGITDCVKQVEVFDASDSSVGEGIVMMPHRATWDDWGDSSFVPVDLQGGTAYRIHVSDFFNMSYLQSNATYSGSGGVSGAVNRANISAVKVLRMR